MADLWSCVDLVFGGLYLGSVVCGALRCQRVLIWEQGSRSLSLFLPSTSCQGPNYSLLGSMEEKELPSVTKLRCYCLFIFLLTKHMIVWTKLGEGQNREKTVSVCVLLSASLPIKSKCYLDNLIKLYPSA